MKSQHAEVKVGAFVILASVAFFGLFVRLSGYLDAFLSPQMAFYSRLADAEGLAEGATVNFAGIPAGRVLTLGYYPEGIPETVFAAAGLAHDETRGDNLVAESGVYRYREHDGRYVLIVFTIENRLAGNLGPSSTIELQQSIFGGPTLNVHPGSVQTGVLAPGSYLPGDASTLAKLVGDLDKLKGRFSRMADKIETVLDNLAGLTRPGGNLDASLAHFEEVTGSLRGLVATLDDRVSSLLAEDAIADLHAAMRSLRSSLASIEASATQHLEPTMVNLEGLTGDLRTLVGENRSGLGELIDSANAALANLRAFSDRLPTIAQEAEKLLGEQDGGLGEAAAELNRVLDSAGGLVADVRARVAEFQWSYLHYLLFAPDADEAAAARAVALARELVLGQEQMARSLAQLDAVLARPQALPGDLRQQLEAQRKEIEESLSRSRSLQAVLFEELRQRERATPQAPKTPEPRVPR